MWSGERRKDRDPGTPVGVSNKLGKSSCKNQKTKTQPPISYHFISYHPPRTPAESSYSNTLAGVKDTVAVGLLPDFVGFV